MLRRWTPLDSHLPHRERSLVAVETRPRRAILGFMRMLRSAPRVLVFALLFCFLTTSARTAEVKEPASRTEVVFDGAENYTDWNLSDGAGWYRESVFTALRIFLSRQADQMIPDGYRLKVTFTDIDLGGRSSRRIPSLYGAPPLSSPTWSRTPPAPWSGMAPRI